MVRGKLSDPRHIESDEAVMDVQGSVEVVVRPLPPSPAGPDVFDLAATQPRGTRSKSNIDHQLREERDSWGGGCAST